MDDDQPLHHALRPDDTIIDTYCAVCAAAVDPVIHDHCPRCKAPKPFAFAHEISYDRWYHANVIGVDIIYKSDVKVRPQN